jgi:cytochrome o ubiquinol oxidase subunit 2
MSNVITVAQAIAPPPPPVAAQRPFHRFHTHLLLLLAAAAMLLLSGCEMALLSPKGDIGVQTRHLIVLSTGIMLAVIIPVIFLTLYFAWRYRASNKKATYAPKWAHSNTIEVVVWSIPCVIVIFLSVLIWRTTHALDPYKPLASEVKPLNVEVVALNWKWLFIYPDYGVATVNELHVPVGTPIAFKLTAESIMNSFFIPQLGSQIYAMAGMQTKLHLIADEPGTYFGMSSAYSGSGFAGMHFKTYATSQDNFDQWVAHARTSTLALDTASYDNLAKPSKANPIATYGTVAPGLFDGIVNKFMMHGPSNEHAHTAALTRSVGAAVCETDIN